MKVRNVQSLPALGHLVFCNVLHIYVVSGPSLLIESTDSISTSMHIINARCASVRVTVLLCVSPVCWHH